MFTGTLDSYQQQPKDKFIGRGNLLVAYTMGLGKTPIAIAAAEELCDQGKISTVLIVCPASLKYQWAQKIAQFTDCWTIQKRVGKESIEIPAQSYCMVIDGDKEERVERYKQAFLARYIIIGYDNVLNDDAQVRDIKPDMVVLDEATAIKTFKAQRTKKIKKVLKAPYRMALTGTPVENRPDEVYSIMQWVDDTVLGRYDLFDKAFIKRNGNGWPVAYKNLPVLHERLAPALSRLTNEDEQVKEFMPEADRDEWFVDMTPEMKKAYKVIAADMLAELDRYIPDGKFRMTDSGPMDESKPSGKLMARYMCLEMLVDHPDLIIKSGMDYAAGEKAGSKYAYELWQSGALDNVTSSPKLEKLIRQLRVLSRRNKVLVFTRYKYMLTLIEERLKELGIGCVQFHGGMSSAKKAEAIAVFTKDPDCTVFLSSHAGAYGVDMYMARWLIKYDLPWSAGTSEQIDFRHIRRSSEFDLVYIRNLIMNGSFEPRKLRIITRKKNLGSAILDNRGSNAGGITLEGDSLRDHLTDVVEDGILE
jgi:SNF2 family DNA or RNA helicase